MDPPWSPCSWSLLPSQAIVEDFVTLQFIPKGTNLKPILPVLAKVFDQVRAKERCNWGGEEEEEEEKEEEQGCKKYKEEQGCKKFKEEQGRKEEQGCKKYKEEQGCKVMPCCQTHC